MPRYSPPSHNDSRLSLGSLTFYKSGTNVKISLYADELETIPIANPVILSVNGSEPNIFYSGSARIVAKDKYNNQVFDRDPVGGEPEFGNFTLFDLAVSYDENDIIVAANDKFYKSLQNGNQGKNPTLLPGANQYWEEINFIGVYNSTITYSPGDIVQTSQGFIWRCVSVNNINNDPSIDNGDNWLPCFDLLKIDAFTKVIPQTGGGELTALRTNEIRDGGTYTLPGASTIEANQTIGVSLPVRFRQSEPVINCASGDTITDNNGTETSITFNSISFGLVYLTSNGTDNWSI